MVSNTSHLGAQHDACVATDSLGAMAADAYAEARGYQRVFASLAAGFPCRVYRKGQHWLVAECRGGAVSREPARAVAGSRFFSGTRAYLCRMAFELACRGETREAREVGRMLLSVPGDRVDYVEVQQPLTEDGELGEIAVSRFGG